MILMTLQLMAGESSRVDSDISVSIHGKSPEDIISPGAYNILDITRVKATISPK
jgi:hypothetical protein